MEDTGNEGCKSDARRETADNVAYNWDKSIALTQGREPALILRSGHSPDKITDESDDKAPWIPFFRGGRGTLV